MDTIDGNYSVENKTSSPLISEGPLSLGLSGTLDLSHTLTDVSAALNYIVIMCSLFCICVCVCVRALVCCCCFCYHVHYSTVYVGACMCFVVCGV